MNSPVANGAACGECQRYPANASRGLCRHCYADKSIRARHPVRDWRYTHPCRLTPQHQEIIDFLTSLPPDACRGTALAKQRKIRRQSAEGQINRLIARGWLTPAGAKSELAELLTEIGTGLATLAVSTYDKPKILEWRRRIEALGFGAGLKGKNHE